MFFCAEPATTEIYTLSLHDALPICADAAAGGAADFRIRIEPEQSPQRKEEDANRVFVYRSEEHTSELQSRRDLVCRLLLEKKKKDHHRLHGASREVGRRGGGRRREA